MSSKKWKRKLKKGELNHLKEMSINSINTFKLTRLDQIKQKERMVERGFHFELCCDCKLIAEKLGLK